MPKASNMSPTWLLESVKAGLIKNFEGTTDQAGYVNLPQGNLLPGVRMEQFEAELEQGDGNELGGSFCAVHSSAALAINTFAPFKSNPSDFVILGRTGLNDLSFEEKVSTGLKGNPPNLDVYLQFGNESIGLESKFTEYFSPKQAEFSKSYNPQKLPWAEDVWWKIKEEAEKSDSRHLDVAQLVKHYFGLSRLIHNGETQSVSLMYVFWEPENAEDLEICQKHREELSDFREKTKGSEVSFSWLPYPDLWREWSEIPALSTHAQNLIDRYSVTVP